MLGPGTYLGRWLQPILQGEWSEVPYAAVGVYGAGQPLVVDAEEFPWLTLLALLLPSTQPVL